ncbi:MAG TPA: hypothetical protein VL326_17705, partial [Kofleriaceae bacterium]|nr:hypothetical protein [Kofleriaceae bacterium]
NNSNFFPGDCVPATCDPLADDPCGDPGAGCFGSSFAAAAGQLYFPTMPQTFVCDVTPSSNGCSAGQIAGTISGTSGCFSLCAPGEAYLGFAGTQQPQGVAPHACGASESCIYSWRFEVDVDGVLHRSATSDTVGICIDHSRLQYDADNDGYVDTPWPSCESQPLHRVTGSYVPDASMMGCVSSTTAGL